MGPWRQTGMIWSVARWAVVGRSVIVVAGTVAVVGTGELSGIVMARFESAIMIPISVVRLVTSIVVAIIVAGLEASVIVAVVGSRELSRIMVAGLEIAVVVSIAVTGPMVAVAVIGSGEFPGG